MKSGSKIIILITLGMILTLFSNNLFLENSKNRENNKLDDGNLHASLVSGKIHIDNNWTAAKTAGKCTGSGTSSDPYVIEDLIINAGSVGSAILIENSNEFFVIQNCTLTNSGSDFYDAGIKLSGAHNGNLTNNLLSNPNAFGIVLWESNDTFIVRNVISGKTGISIRFSNNTNTYLNTVSSSIFNVETHYTTNNKWDTPKKLKYTYNNRTYSSYMGNYWSEYNEVDSNNDGIGDTPYILDQHLPSAQWVYLDSYPLVDPLSNYTILGEASGSSIPSYSLFILMGIISLTSLLILKRAKKSSNTSASNTN